jgi:hypothetical protein
MGTRSFDEAPSDVGADDFVATLAARTFESDPAINRVYVAANTVQVTRRRGWDEAASGAVASVITELFRFYS